MNIKRAIFFGALLWVCIFVILLIIMFPPGLLGKDMMQFGFFWVLLVPLTLFLAKWYFKQDPPSFKKGFLLGIVALVVITLLDLVITVPLFVKSYDTFYGNWILYVGLLEIWILCAFGGWEFDRTFTKREVESQKTKEE